MANNEAPKMNCSDAIKLGSAHLQSLGGHVFDVVDLSKPVSTSAAVNLCKFVSKLSPLIGNLIEFNAVEFLNAQHEFKAHGTWVRQDPGFPDAIFDGQIDPKPGFEVKAWFPMATEITARFKDSQNHFDRDQTYVVVLAWLPQSIIFGKPYILDVCVVSGASMAKSRDDHYHNPPDYLVLEPEDTKSRTSNLQQTTTSGHKWQGSDADFEKAKSIVKAWGKDGMTYKPTPEYQSLVRQLEGQFSYRLDTNFAKIDRIGHDGIELFKKRVLKMKVQGRSVAEWTRLLFSKAMQSSVPAELQKQFGIPLDPKEKETDVALLQ